MVILWLLTLKGGSDELKSQSVDPLIRNISGEKPLCRHFRERKSQRRTEGSSQISEVVTGPDGESHLEVGVGTYDERPTK
ncbi:MAG: hypothetical protein Ct9H90mP5_04900 [Acidimicrobiaceae bacterium]|nr:MAG: hypothetical protein Ct9H90mP5_04900 [Acidimicrobiaceae bacterium]